MPGRRVQVDPDRVAGASTADGVAPPRAAGAQPARSRSCGWTRYPHIAVCVIASRCCSTTTSSPPAPTRTPPPNAPSSKPSWNRSSQNSPTSALRSPAVGAAPGGGSGEPPRIARHPARGGVREDPRTLGPPAPRPPPPTCTCAERSADHGPGRRTRQLRQRGPHGETGRARRGCRWPRTIGVNAPRSRSPPRHRWAGDVRLRRHHRGCETPAGQPNAWRRNVTADPRIPQPRRGGEPKRGNAWRVERLDTEPISQDQHRHAVRALAALITAWQTSRPPAHDDA